MNFTGNSNPTQQWWRSPCQPTDHDILWRGALEKHGVDKGIAHRGGQG